MFLMKISIYLETKKTSWSLYFNSLALSPKMISMFLLEGTQIILLYTFWCIIHFLSSIMTTHLVSIILLFISSSLATLSTNRVDKVWFFGQKSWQFFLYFWPLSGLTLHERKYEVRLKKKVTNCWPNFWWIWQDNIN